MLFIHCSTRKLALLNPFVIHCLPLSALRYVLTAERKINVIQESRSGLWIVKDKFIHDRLTVHFIPFHSHSPYKIDQSLLEIVQQHNK